MSFLHIRMVSGCRHLLRAKLILVTLTNMNAATETMAALGKHLQVDLDPSHYPKNLMTTGNTAVTSNLGIDDVVASKQLS